MSFMLLLHICKQDVIELTMYFVVCSRLQPVSRSTEAIAFSLSTSSVPLSEAISDQIAVRLFQKFHMQLSSISHAVNPFPLHAKIGRACTIQKCPPSPQTNHQNPHP